MPGPRRDEEPDNANEAFFAAMLRHQIGLLRVAGRIRERIFRILDATEKDIAEQIRERLAGVSGIERPATIRRLRTLHASIRAIRNQAWTRSVDVWREELLAISRAEPEFVSRAMFTVSPVRLDFILPSAALLSSIVTSRPFEGRLLRDWARNIRRADLDRIEQAINIGMVQGESAAQIARRVVGTARLRGRNGVTEITRRNADAITRTAIISITNQAKREFYKANEDIISEELYVATLDGRTTPICRALDGQTFPVGEGPIPPLHIRCRSVRVALLDGEVIGARPAKNFTQQQLLREYTTANGLASVSARGRLPRGHKGLFDKFSRQRIRDLTGNVDANITYQDWLGRQSRQFQDDVLGPTRGRLFRRGGLQLDRFVNRRGDQITLAQLAERETAAFRAAGLDPDAF